MIVNIRKTPTTESSSFIHFSNFVEKNDLNYKLMKKKVTVDINILSTKLPAIRIYTILKVETKLYFIEIFQCYNIAFPSPAFVWRSTAVFHTVDLNPKNLSTAI